MEQLYVLGTGNATSIRSFNTCFALKEGDDLLLTDTGGGNSLLLRLDVMGIPLRDIHHVFLSHAHMDHCLGALWIIRVLSVPMEKGEYTEPMSKNATSHPAIRRLSPSLTGTKKINRPIIL